MKQLAEFESFLKSEFSFTTEKYYTELGMIYGMIFGSGIGLSIGTAIHPPLGISMGYPSELLWEWYLAYSMALKKMQKPKKLERPFNNIINTRKLIV